MITSKKLTAERLEEIKNYPICYDEDSPKLTKEQIARLRPAHEAYWNGYSCGPSVIG